MSIRLITENLTDKASEMKQIKIPKEVMDSARNGQKSNNDITRRLEQLVVKSFVRDQIEQVEENAILSEPEEGDQAFQNDLKE